MDIEQVCDMTHAFNELSERGEICDLASDSGSSVFGPSVNLVYLYDRYENGLVKNGTSSKADQVLRDSHERISPGESPVWNVYRSMDSRIIDATELDSILNLDSDYQPNQAFLLPLRHHGVLVSVSGASVSFKENATGMGKILSKILTTSLDRVEWERRLHKAQETTNDLVTASSREDVVRILLNRAAEVFELPITSVWKYDVKDRALYPVGATDKADEMLDELPTFRPGNSIAWEVYESGEPRIVDHVETEDLAYDQSSPIQSELIVPIGDFGVVLAGSTLPHDFVQPELELLQTLAMSASSAIQTLEQQRDLELLHQVLGRILRHNIRNDVTVIHGYANRIRQSCCNDDCVKRAERILDRTADLRSTAKHAGEMREAISSRREYTCIELSEVLMEAQAVINRRYPDAEVEVDKHESIKFRAHPDFSRALRHIIENGIEHNSDPEPVVEVRTYEDEDDLVIEIEDNGPGLPDGELEPVREGVETVLKHGSGAGLWLIDRIIEYSDAEIDYLVDDDGTTARIRL